MANQRLDAKLLTKLANRTGKNLKYLREQISRKASRQGISSEAALIIWAKELGIGTASALRKSSGEIRHEVRTASPTAPAPKTPVRDYRKAGDRATSQKAAFRNAIDNLLHDDELRSRCRDLLTAPRHFDRVFREATTLLETRIKKIAGIKQRMEFGDLVGKVLNPDPLKAVLVVSNEQAEHQGFFYMCRGLGLSFRNPAHHSLSEKFSREDALKFCAFVDTVLSVLKTATVHPERA